MPLKGLDTVKKAMNVDIYLQMNDIIKGVYLGGLRNIIEPTPFDTGVTRNNWFLTVGSPSTKLTNVGGAPNFNQLNKMPKRVLNRKLYFTNNKPNIITLEYGGYPNPVKRGSLINGKYQKLSKGGFSKQAPGGWVRSALILMANKIRSLSP